MSLFEKLYNLSESHERLSLYLNEEVQTINDYINTNYNSIKDDKIFIERFILLKADIIRDLDYGKSHNKAFLSILLELCERLCLTAAILQINSILEQVDLFIGSRLKAALLYLLNIDSNQVFIDRYENICSHIQMSIDNEDDDEKKAIATFLSYYSYVLYNTHLDYTTQLRKKIDDSRRNGQYNFLTHIAIDQAYSINIDDTNNAYLQLQAIIDAVLGRRPATYSYETEQEILIEEGSDYSIVLNSVDKSIRSVRDISVRRYREIENRQAVYNSLGRGVSVINEENQLYAYMNSLGNAHIAKIESALETIDFSEIITEVEIIDWGCGQALASMVLLQHIESLAINLSLEYITLIEPSLIALRRAALHIKHFNNINISTICKDFDSLNSSDIFTDPDRIKIHLLSNILDVEFFSLSHLVEIIVNTFSGRNFFICVSPFITDRKADRVDSFKRYFESNYQSFRLYGYEQNTKDLDDIYWSCNNNYNGNLGVYCNHPECGCRNKWTRVLRVFEVTI